MSFKKGKVFINAKIDRKGVVKERVSYGLKCRVQLARSGWVPPDQISALD